MEARISAWHCRATRGAACGSLLRVKWVLEERTKGFSSILFLCHTELLCQEEGKKKGNRKNNSFNRELSPYFVLVGFQPWRFICCAATAGTQETAQGMQNWWERWQNEACCYARPAERGKDSLAESRSFLGGPAPAAHGSQVNLCEMTVFEELPLQRMRVKHQRPLFCSSAAGVELTWPRSRNKEGFPFSFFGMHVSCFSEYLHDHKFRALEDIFSQRLHVQDTIM